MITVQSSSLPQHPYTLHLTIQRETHICLRGGVAHFKPKKKKQKVQERNNKKVTWVRYVVLTNTNYLVFMFIMSCCISYFFPSKLLALSSSFSEQKIASNKWHFFFSKFLGKKGRKRRKFIINNHFNVVFFCIPRFLFKLNSNRFTYS